MGTLRTSVLLCIAFQLFPAFPTDASTVSISRIDGSISAETLVAGQPHTIRIHLQSDGSSRPMERSLAQQVGIPSRA